MKGGSLLKQGITVWFTGLSGAGKTTVSRLIETKLKARGVDAVELLDGDLLRAQVNTGLGFTREDRERNIRIASFIAGLLSRHGVIVLASFISPYRKDREACRQQIGLFAEVYVKCSLEECIRRDVKGLYCKALNGEIERFTGISDPYEEPLQPELILDTDRETVEESADKVIAFLVEQGYVS